MPALVHTLYQAQPSSATVAQRQWQKQFIQWYYRMRRAALDDQALLDTLDDDRDCGSVDRRIYDTVYFDCAVTLWSCTQSAILQLLISVAIHNLG